MAYISSNFCLDSGWTLFLYISKQKRETVKLCKKKEFYS